jgi:hypothetical protein
MAQERRAQLTVSLIDDVSAGARSVEAALAQSEARIKELSAAMGEAGGSDRLLQSLNKLGATKSDVESVARAFVDYTKSAGLAGDASQWTKEAAAGVRAWENQTISSVRAVIAERRAETTALRNAAAEQAQILQRQATEQREQVRAQKEAATQRRELARGVAGGIGGGIVGAIVGGEALEAIKESLGLGMTLDQRVAQLRGMGLTPDQINASRAQFREYSKTHAGVSEAEWLKARGEASTIAPGDEAEMTELSATYRGAARNTGVSVGEGDFKSIMRTMDLMGVKTAEERRKFLDEMLKIQQKYQGTVTPETYLSAVQNLRSAKFALSPEFMTKYFPTLLAAAGEQGGTEVMTAFNNYIGGHMTHSELQKLAADGFVNDSDLVRTKTGAIVGTKPGSKMFEEGTFEKNPYQWSLDFHDAYMKRQGSTEESFDKLVMSMPRNMGAMIQEFVHNKNTFDRDAANQGQAGLAASTNDWMAKNPAAGAEALKTSFEQLATSITAPGVQALGPALAAAAQGVQTFAADIGSLNQNMVALGGGVLAAVTGFGALKAAFGVGGSMFGGFGLKGSALALDESAAALTRAAVVMGGGQVSTAGAAASVGGIARAGLGAAAAITGAVLAGSEAGNKEVFADPSVIARLKADDARKQANFDRDGFWKGSWENMFGAPGVEIRRPAPGRDVHSPSSGPFSYTPAVNTSQIDGAAAKIDSLSQHQPSVDVHVSTGMIDAAIDKAHQLEDVLRRIGSLSFTGPGMPPSYGSHARGNFTASGFISGE